VKNYFVAFFLTLLLAACTGKPSDSDIEEQIVAFMMNDDLSRDFVSINSIEKINGFEKNSNTYIAVVRYEIEFKKSLDDFRETLTSRSGDILERMQVNIAVGVLKRQYGNFSAGQKMEETREFTFINTDNGWVLAD
jgi:hypothetical protein